MHNIRMFVSSRRLPLPLGESIAHLGLDSLSILSLSTPLLGGTKNPTGRNQWGEGSLGACVVPLRAPYSLLVVQRFPDLPELVQGYLNRGRSHLEILDKLQKEHSRIPEFSCVVGYAYVSCANADLGNAHWPI